MHMITTTYHRKWCIDENDNPSTTTTRMHWRKWQPIDHHNLSSTRMHWWKRHAIDHHNTSSKRMRWRKWHAIDHHNTSSTMMHWQKGCAINHHNMSSTRMHRRRWHAIVSKVTSFWALAFLTNFSTTPKSFSASFQPDRCSLALRRLVYDFVQRVTTSPGNLLDGLPRNPFLRHSLDQPMFCVVRMMELLLRHS